MFVLTFDSNGEEKRAARHQLQLKYKCVCRSDKMMMSFAFDEVCVAAAADQSVFHELN